MSRSPSARKNIFTFFFIPAFVLFTLVLALLIHLTIAQPQISTVVLLLGIALGSWQLLRDSYNSIRHNSFALDYIAILAIGTGLVTGNYVVSAIIVLMMSGGNTLEMYAQELARKSLTALSNRIPHDVVVVDQHNKYHTISISKVEIGSTVLVRKGEVVPLDGILLSHAAEFDESSLIGEPYPISKEAGDQLRSGIVNIGEAIQLKTTVKDENSTYRKIIQLVEQAQNEKTPFLQLADKLSGGFTIVTLVLAAGAYALSGDLSRVLAVLVIATPCPLILATPIALIGGMNAATHQKIIFKRLAAIEILSRVQAMIFDKTGTLTFGVPELTEIKLLDTKKTESEVLALVAGLERNSLHPFAKAVLAKANQQHMAAVHFSSIQETVGVGLEGVHEHKTYRITKDPKHADLIVLTENSTRIAQLTFTDVLKPSSLAGLQQLQKMKIALHMFTGDTAERAQQLIAKLPIPITVKAECSPEEKRTGIAALKRHGLITAMVGDGINDAPALALADVGLVFSHEEQTAASEAADVVLLGGHFESVLGAVQVSHRTMFIAKQSMYIGLGLSLCGMLFALAGYLPPIAGAVSQEIIDVAVILNALRAARPMKKMVLG